METDFADLVKNLDLMAILQLTTMWITTHIYWVFAGFLAFLVAWTMKGRRR